LGFVLLGWTRAFALRSTAGSIDGGGTIMMVAAATRTERGSQFGRRWRAGAVLAVVLAVAGSGATAAAAPSARIASDASTLRVLVTNDDGVGAPGISALVNALQSLPNTEVTVIAPATNQSGTGINFTTGNLTVAPATTASGDTATAVTGTPSDTVLYGVLTALVDARPHVVVSGVNQGQNLGNFTDLSGTVGAARTANRLGVPAIAVSAGFGPSPNYFGGALVAAAFVQGLRSQYVAGTVTPQTINLNVPTCTSGNARGLAVVPLGRTSDISGYTLQSGTVGNGVFAPTVVSQNAVATANCTSTLTNPSNDIEAFNNGFVTATTLNPDLGDR
jgi:5'-nucleotidase